MLSNVAKNLTVSIDYDKSCFPCSWEGYVFPITLTHVGIKSVC